MPAMPRPSKKSIKIVEKILGKPDNKQGDTRVKVQVSQPWLNTSLDSWYNHPV